jgi:hypothetical protein
MARRALSSHLGGAPLSSAGTGAVLQTMVGEPVSKTHLSIATTNLQPGTLRVRKPIGQTLGAALVIWLLLMGLAEAIFRNPGIRAQFTAPSRGGTHRLFEIQLDRLNTIATQNGSIECLALGNSMVWQGFDPFAVEEGYREATGRDLKCFNFGVDGLPASAAGAVAEILMSAYRPRLLIYGTDARDFAVPREAPDATSILENPWVRYRLGEFTPDGWLWEHSYLYQYRWHLQEWLRFDYSRALRAASKRWSADRRGFDPDDSAADYIHNPPDPQDVRPQIRYYFGVLGDYQIRPENLAGLDQILRLRASGVQVIVMAMPMPATYMGFFGQGAADYEYFTQQIEAAARPYGVPFWETTSLHLIPENGWLDYSHLNTRGARAFGLWLGRRLGEAVIAHEISLTD